MPPLHPGLRNGRYYGGIDLIETVSTRQIESDRIYFSIIFLPEQTTITRIGCEVVSAGGTYGRLGIYFNDDTMGWPRKLLYDAGLIDTSTSGLKEIAITLDVSPGWYWLAGLFNGQPSLRGKSTGEYNRAYTGTPNIVAGNFMPIYNYTFGLLPNIIPVLRPEYGGTSGNNTHFPGNVPYFWFRVGVN